MTKVAASPDLYPRKVAMLLLLPVGALRSRQCPQGCVFLLLPAKCTPRTSWGTRGDIGGYFVSNVVTVVKQLLLSCFDVFDGVAYSLNLLSFLIGYLDAEFLLKLHDEVHCVERVCAQVCGECCCGGYLAFVNAEFVNDDGLHAICDF